MGEWVVPLVLLAAVMHAGWNSLLKGGGDRLVGITMLNVWCAVAGLFLLPFAGPLPPAAWPYLAASLGFHTAYQVFLVRTYRLGDLSQVYPVARGAAPPLVALTGLLLGTDMLRPAEGLAVLLIAAGIAALALRGGAGLRTDPRPVLMALATASFIAGYTTVDGLGARAGGDSVSYTAWLFILNAPPMVALAWARRGAAGLWQAMRAGWRCDLVGGAMALTGYGIAIWAMTHAPIALVAALRETSVIFALLIAKLWLKEPVGRWRAGSALLVLAGIATLRLA
ncbi:EamA family transporter [Niveispirillum sp. KHB5.9]|uniref:EamA family transporter n=1 Tax=Niveispirillum sp. KHB5.9 TaxID=3400269 RepID=UPI003A883562